MKILKTVLAVPDNVICRTTHTKLIKAVKGCRPRPTDIDILYIYVSAEASICPSNMHYLNKEMLISKWATKLILPVPVNAPL